jgi:hypothetical protein
VQGSGEWFLAAADGKLPRMGYVRFESATPNSRGGRTGIFGLANGLASSGRLSPDDWSWWRTNNDWGDAAYTDPATVDPTLFDKETYRRATCWFKDSANHLLEQVTGYLDLLDRYGIGWVELRSNDPGTILYEDEVQVVVTPSPATAGATPLSDDIWIT